MVFSSGFTLRSGMVLFCFGAGAVGAALLGTLAVGSPTLGLVLEMGCTAAFAGTLADVFAGVFGVTFVAGFDATVVFVFTAVLTVALGAGDFTLVLAVAFAVAVTLGAGLAILLTIGLLVVFVGVLV